MTVADARAGLSAILRRFRSGDRSPVVIGSHRRAEAVIVPVDGLTGAAPCGHAAQESVLDQLKRRSDLIRRIAAMNRIDAVAVFGSVARGEERGGSDVDLLVTPNDRMTLFDLAQFEIDMEALTGRPVDAVSRRSLDADRDGAIMARAITL